MGTLEQIMFDLCLHTWHPCHSAKVQFNFGKKVVEQRATRETVIPEPSYNLPIALAGNHVCSTIVTDADRRASVWLS